MEWSNTIYRMVRRPFVEYCAGKGISSIQISIFNHVMTLTLGCFFFSRGTYWGGILGLAICLINGFLDYLDGDVARTTNATCKVAAWLDSGFDVIVQFVVMGAISIGCYKMGMPLIWIVLFFIGNAANNFVSFNYNAKFGFDSDKGNELFRQYMDKKRNGVNVFFKNLIDPTSSWIALAVFTLRYFIAVGSVFNVMPVCFIILTVISNFKWAIMYSVYALYLAGDKRLHVLKALTVLDEETNDFYRVRSS